MFTFLINKCRSLEKRIIQLEHKKNTHLNYSTLTKFLLYEKQNYY